MPVKTASKARKANKCNNCGQDPHVGKCDASSKVCTRCQKVGHASRRCPTHKRAKPTSTTTATKTAAANNTANKQKPYLNLYCDNCEEQGHGSQQCPKPSGFRKRRCQLCCRIGHTADHCFNAQDWYCLNCKEWGHLEPTCPKPRGYLRMHCVRCKEPGHLAEYCTYYWRWKCMNCYAWGHYHTECSMPRIGRKCFICGAHDHVIPKCPQKMCYKCGGTGHFGAHCTDPAWSDIGDCEACGSEWHVTADCPLLGNTTEDEEHTNDVHAEAPQNAATGATFNSERAMEDEAPPEPKVHVPDAAVLRKLDEARDKLAEERFKEAIRLLTEAIAWDSKFPDLYSTRGTALSRSKDYVGALSDFSTAHKLRGHEPSVEIWIETARCRFRLGSRSSALLAVREALTLDAGNLVALSLKRCLTELETHFEAYRAARSRKHWRVARTAYEACIKIYEDREVEGTLEVECWGVEILIAEHVWTKALVAVEKITGKHSTEPEGLALKARVLMLSGKLDAALDQAVVVLKLDPDNIVAKHLRSRLKDVRRLKEEGNSSYQMGEWWNASEKYTRALEILAEGEEDTKGGLMRATLLLNRATAHYKMCSYNDGLKDANEALTLDPAYFKAYRVRARIYVGLELYESAVEDFKAAVEHGALLLNADDMSTLKEELEDAERTAEHERNKAKDYYGVLGLPWTCSAVEIKKAYRMMSLKHHPDKGGIAEKFKLVKEAYETLSDPGARSLYDMKSHFTSSSFYESDSAYFSQGYERSWRDSDYY